MSTANLSRIAALVGTLLVCDVVFLWFAASSVLENGLGVVVLFGGVAVFGIEQALR